MSLICLPVSLWLRCSSLLSLRRYHVDVIWRRPLTHFPLGISANRGFIVASALFATPSRLLMGAQPAHLADPSNATASPSAKLISPAGIVVSALTSAWLLTASSGDTPTVFFWSAPVTYYPICARTAIVSELNRDSLHGGPLVVTCSVIRVVC